MGRAAPLSADASLKQRQPRPVPAAAAAAATASPTDVPPERPFTRLRASMRFGRKLPESRRRRLLTRSG